MSRPSKPVITTTTQTQHTQPWSEQIPYLKFAFQEAQRLYNDTKPAYYAKSTIVEPAPQSEDALKLQEERALQGSELLKKSKTIWQQVIEGKLLNSNPAQSSLMDTLKQSPQSHPYFEKTAQGQFFEKNPLLDLQFQRAAKAMTDHYNTDVKSKIDMEFAKAGRLGSEYHQKTIEKKEKEHSSSIKDLAREIYGNHYQYERNMQTEAAKQIDQYHLNAQKIRLATLAQLAQTHETERRYQMQAAEFAPQMAQSDYDDIAKLADVGGIREAIAQTQLNDDIQRFNYATTLPQNKLAQYIALVSGGYGAETLTSTTQPLYRENVKSYGENTMRGVGKALHHLSGDEPNHVVPMIGKMLFEALK